MFRIKVWMNQPWKEIVCVQKLNEKGEIDTQYGYTEGEADADFQIKGEIASNVIVSTLAQGLNKIN